MSQVRILSPRMRQSRMERSRERGERRRSESDDSFLFSQRLLGLLSPFTSLMAFTFEKLIVYQKAIDFADRICKLTEQFPRGYGFLTDQLNRAALSVAANIAEGNGRFTKPDRRNFFGIARGSVQECVPLLELAKRRCLVTADQHATLKANLEEIARMLSGLIASTLPPRTDDAKSV